jgi:hypothetical protein
MRYIPTLRVIRMLGVPLGIFCLWPGGYLPVHLFGHQWSPLLFSIGIFTCIPYSRIRRAALFWPALLVYAVLAIALGVVFGWDFIKISSAADFQDTGTLIYSSLVFAGFLLLFAQLPCILILRRYREKQPNTARGCVKTF